MQKIRRLLTCLWTTLDIACILFLPLVFILVCDPFGYVAYWCGLHSPPMLSGRVFLVLCYLLLPTGVAVLYSVARIGFLRNKKSIRKWVLAAVCIFCAAIFFDLLGSSKPTIHYFHDGFAKRMNSRVDFQRIRNWLTTIPADRFDDSLYQVAGEGVNVCPVEIPAFIIGLDGDLSYVRFTGNRNDNRCLELIWGGGFFHWGLVIGSVEMLIPESTTYPDSDYFV